MLKISIVIPTYNSLRFLRQCLDSISKQDYHNFEVIVVDNGSLDSTADLIKEEYPRTILIENKKNLGACAARNQGIEASFGEWVLVLDSDVVLEENFLSGFLKIHSSLALDIGLLQAKILKPDQKTIYSAGISLSAFRRFYDIGQGKPDNQEFANAGYVFGACSAAAFLRKAMLLEIKEPSGYFDERFFFLVEDVDLAWRAQTRGWKAIFSPALVCYHSGNSSGYNREKRQYLCFRNRYYSIKKNEGIKNYIKKIFPLLFYDFPRALFLISTNRYLFRKNSQF